MKKYQRRIYYLIEFYGKQVFTYFGHILYWFFIRILTEDVYDCIRISDCKHTGKARETKTPLFVDSTKKALKLISEVDAKRYKRISKEINFIVNESCGSTASYQRIGKICRVDFQQFQLNPETPYYDRNLSIYAACIVHEATHGTFETYSIPYNKRTARRIEYICYQEELNFLKHILNGSSKSPTELIGYFNWDDWEIGKNRPLNERATRLRKRLTKIIQEFCQDQDEANP